MKRQSRKLDERYSVSFIMGGSVPPEGYKSTTLADGTVSLRKLRTPSLNSKPKPKSKAEIHNEKVEAKLDEILEEVRNPHETVNQTSEPIQSHNTQHINYSIVNQNLGLVPIPIPVPVPVLTPLNILYIDEK
jgi:hypothetical protein